MRESSAEGQISWNRLLVVFLIRKKNYTQYIRDNPVSSNILNTFVSYFDHILQQKTKKIINDLTTENSDQHK